MNHDVIISPSAVGRLALDQELCQKANQGMHKKEAERAACLAAAAKEPRVVVGLCM